MRLTEKMIRENLVLSSIRVDVEKKEDIPAEYTQLVELSGGDSDMTNVLRNLARRTNHGRVFNLCVNGRKYYYMHKDDGATVMAFYRSMQQRQQKAPEPDASKNTDKDPDAPDVAKEISLMRKDMVRMWRTLNAICRDLGVNVTEVTAA